MSKVITIVTGSARPNSVGAKLLPLVQRELEKYDSVSVQVADLADINMPFVDTEIIPADEGFSPKHKSVQEWQKTVQSSDGFIFLVPEYNNQISAIQKNAIDWLYPDWKGKKMSFVGYSWGGAALVVELLNKLAIKVGAEPLPTATNLFFTKDIELNGTIIDEDLVEKKISQTVAELVSA